MEGANVAGNGGQRDGRESPRLSTFQRAALRRLRRAAGKPNAEPLSPEDWPAVWLLHHDPRSRLLHRIFAALPSSPRCCQCGAPFAGIGRAVTRPLGYRPSRKNPHYCATCDEVMVMYLGLVHSGDAAPAIMLEQAAGLLEAVGYGSTDGPFVEVGIGLDYGEAFVGNIGDRAVHDFTAVGDVVNTAARLQAMASGGEIICSERIAAHLGVPPGEAETVTLRGKQVPEVVYRLPRSS